MRAAYALVTLLAAATAAHAQPVPPGPTRPAIVTETCPSTPPVPLVLPHVRDTIASNHDVIVVAIGSSSTEGWHASNVGHSYPATLQRLLNARVPGAHFSVINRGIGGQDVSEELPRLGRDALAVRPALVIWQVGANGAMSQAAPDVFKQLLASGVRRLKDAGVDVILMDNQRAPVILAAPHHDLIDQAMSDVATSEGVGLFRRGSLMDQWRDAGFPYDRFMSDDGVHHNDYGYLCVATALGTDIVAGLQVRPDPSPAPKL